ncbi:TonB-dependent receptor [Meridianimaribacter flavus]|uniref:Hemoglobin/transferrin/lactoferrin receptor protein n=1 Tax=Meridianimaribacter flavus TaxID=571115 RepID=A0ABY2G7F0_9FLAO|nr:TonB-dependent receptor [Meridianimaribacter flavus]TDY13733.1 hemoglobin/transferrin/lactoferrin receptor protein [Meridianimaribacter flavus]
MKHKFLFVLICFTSFLQAQQIQVIEKGTNLPISGVTIYNSDKSKSVITDIDGYTILSQFDDNEAIFFQNLLYQKLRTTKEEIASNNFIVYLTQNVEGLNEVVVSASKFEQSKRDIPQKVISFDAEKIQFSNPQTSADLLENTGNIYVQKSQLGGGSPMIRGFSTNRLLITIDGVRMNNAIFRGGNLQNVISIDPFSIQNTEVNLGAGSVVYGSDAIGGVMSFYTKKPQLSYSDSLFFKANAVARYATANSEKTGHLDLNFGLKKWAFLTSVSYTDFDDLRMGAHGPDEYIRPEYVETINGEDVIVANDEPLVQKPTGYDQINLLQKIKYQPEDNQSFDLGLYYTETSEYSRYDRLIRYRGDNLRSAEWNYGPQRWFMANLQYTKLSSNSSFYDKIQTNVAFQNFQESRIDRDFQSVERNTTEESVNAISFNLDLEKQLGSKTELFYGVEYVYNKIKSEGNTYNIETNETANAVSRYPDGSDWQSMAAYTSLKYKPNPKFVFQTGVRYNHIISNADFTENNQFLNLPFNESKINAGAFTGTAGISWIPNETIQWKLNASSAFRAPNMDDIGKVFDSEPGSVVVPNNNLKPEYAYGGELGLNLNFDQTFIIDLSTYYTYLDNALVRRDFNINGETEIEYNGELSNVQAIQNASKAWIYGFEAGAQLNFSEKFKLTTQYNIIGGTEEDNDIEVPVRHAAPNFGNTHLVWQNDKLQLDAFAVYNNELSFNQLAPSEAEKDYIYALDANGNPYSPSWYTLNLRTKYKITDAATLIASLENITDQRYKTYSSGIASAGRNLILSLMYTL